MKKKIIIRLLLALVIIVGFILGFVLYKTFQKNKELDRYAEIKESTKGAVEWMIRAQYPRCSIAQKKRKNFSLESFYNSSFLINQGYIKKSELLDIDKVSYCDVYVKIYTYFEDPLDYQHNCEVYYKIFLKCKDYKDKGYMNWGS